MKILFLIAAIGLFSFISAQNVSTTLGPCDLASYEGCIQAISEFQIATCNSLAGNATLSGQCACYASVKKAVCYTTACISQNATIAAQAASLQASTPSQCQAVGLNPNALPANAPWCNGGICATPTATPTSVSSAAPTSTTPAKANSAAGIARSGLISLLVVVVSLY